MKKIICILAAVMMFSTVAYAGEWQLDERGYWYKNDDGTWPTGWFQDTDGVWYYLDRQSGYMLSNTVTPDGYLVSADGSWVEDVTEKFLYDNEQYDHKAEIVITAYSTGPDETDVLEYPLPVTVYYNNIYENVSGGKIRLYSVTAASNGVAYAYYHVNTDSGSYGMTAKCRYNLENGSHVDSEESIFNYCKSGGVDGSHHLLWKDIVSVTEKSSALVSATICIKEQKKIK